MPDAATVNDFVQHAVVSVVALGALGVVLRRVLGVFERRPPAIVRRARRRAHRGAATAPPEARRTRSTALAESQNFTCRIACRRPRLSVFDLASVEV